MAPSTSSTANGSPGSAAQSVCVIGAGPSGLAMLRAMAAKATVTTPLGASANPVRDALGVEVVCFDKQPGWGGLWRFDWHTGTDARGEPVHASMYRHLWSNGPKEALEFADYTFDAHFGRPIPSYPPRQVLLDYIEGRIMRADVTRYCRFSSAVQVVRWDEARHKFEVSVCDYDPATNRSAVDDPITAAVAPLVANRESPDTNTRVYTMLFDNVVVASGHFSTPNVPSFAGLEEFKGRVLHAHDYRDGAEFAGQRVLCIGASYSAEDIASQLYKFGARHVCISFRTAAPGFDWPAGVEEVPLLQHMSADGRATFRDGSERDVDAIILCTGYVHHLPFLAPELRLQTRNRIVVNDLYRGVVWPHNKRLYYIGMQGQWFTFNMFDAQAWFVRDLILSGNAAVKALSVETMQAETQGWLARQDAVQTPTDSILLQGEYVKSLLRDITDYPLTAAQVDGMSKCFIEGKQRKKLKNGIMTFRDHVFRSAVTGTMAAEHGKTWLEEFDDSLVGFLNGSSA